MDPLPEIEGDAIWESERDGEAEGIALIDPLPELEEDAICENEMDGETEEVDEPEMDEETLGVAETVGLEVWERVLAAETEAVGVEVCIGEGDEDCRDDGVTCNLRGRGRAACAAPSSSRRARPPPPTPAAAFLPPAAATSDARRPNSAVTE
jgi:hypothetical protein